MNLLFLCNRDLASNYALNLILPNLSGHKVNLMLSDKVGGNQSKPPALNQLAFYEQALFNQVISPLKNRTETSEKFRSFEELSVYLNRPAQTLNAINSEAGIQIVESLKPELIISIRYGSILKQAVLSIPQFGVLNLHSGLLPAYRGVMATFWAMLKGESSIGTTLHFIESPDIDEGAVIEQTHLPVNPERSYLWHVLQLYPDGCSRILDTIQKIEQAEVIATKPQKGEANYYSFPTQQKIDEFQRANLSLVNQEEWLDFITEFYC